MFHHFHDEKDKKFAQGSITNKQLEKLILKIGPDNIKEPDFWLKNYKKSKKKIFCFSFDDSLLCQYKYAFPVLQKYNIKSMFFIYSSVLENKISNFEIFRLFRYTYFDNFSDFYKKFLKEYKNVMKKNIDLKKYLNKINKIKKNYPFYSNIDINFRIIRDDILSNDQFTKIMNTMIGKKTTKKKLSKNLWMKNKQLKNISNSGHILGLHGYNHPFNFAQLDYSSQVLELKKNSNHLEKISGNKPYIIAYPSNSYSKNTIKILKDMKVKYGFRSDFKDNSIFKKRKNNYEISRLDHTLLIRKYGIQ